jgi:hypothetical protein
MTPPPAAPGPSSTSPAPVQTTEPAPSNVAPPTEPPPPPASPPTTETAAPAEQASASAGTAPAASPAAPAAPSDPPGVHQHDGFFLRLSSGFSSWSESLKTEKDSNVYDGTVEGKSTGIASSGDVTIGGNLSRSLVLAGSLQTTSLLASTFRQTESSVAAPPAELDPGLRELYLLGPAVLYYPNDRGGFFLEGGLGVAVLTPGNAAGVNRADGKRYVAGGAGLSLSIGQQWFIAEQFSVGVRARVSGAVAGGKDQDGVRWIHVVGASPAVLFDIVYH